MTDADLDEVVAIERASYPTPWVRASFRFEIHDNRAAHNHVVRRGGRVAAYACVWVVREEMKINNFTVHPELRGRGLGSAMMRSLLEWARRRGCTEATLEVRPSNSVARGLYVGRGFRVVGRRKNYYRDTGEDALVMSAALRAGPGAS